MQTIANVLPISNYPLGLDRNRRSNARVGSSGVIFASSILTTLNSEARETTPRSSEMADNPQSDQSKSEEAIVGVKADVKTLQQLSSSSNAAKENRNRIKEEKAIRLFEEAVQEGVQGGKGQSSGTGGGK